jgi:hypothetical protein
VPGRACAGRSLFAAFSVVALALPAAAPAARGGPAVTRLDVSPARISAPGGDTTVRFDLARPGTVVFTLGQVAPVARTVGRFGVRGRTGPNRFLFPGRIDTRLLRPGTYRLTAAGTNGRSVGATLVVTGADAAPGVGSPERPENGSPVRGPLVVGVLLVAIALLGLAALPAATSGPRAAELLATHRPAVALTGGVALTAAFALYLASVF